MLKSKTRLFKFYKKRLKRIRSTDNGKMNTIKKKKMMILKQLADKIYLADRKSHLVFFHFQLLYISQSLFKLSIE